MTNDIEAFNIALYASVVFPSSNFNKNFDFRIQYVLEFKIFNEHANLVCNIKMKKSVWFLLRFQLAVVNSISETEVQNSDILI